MDAQAVRGDSERSRCLVLLSGGIDSSALVFHACREWGFVETMFVDYGQACACGEARAARAISREAGVAHGEVAVRGRHFGAGEIRGRNAFLIHTAMLMWDARAGSIGLGIHAHSAYKDCSPEFTVLIQQSMDLHAGGAISLATPFLHWTKGEVFLFARELGVPLHLTHGCETSGDAPCGVCESCRDREQLFASAH